MGAQEVDERPGRRKDVYAHIRLEVFAVARRVGQNAGLELGSDLAEDRRTRLKGIEIGI